MHLINPEIPINNKYLNKSNNNQNNKTMNLAYHNLQALLYVIYKKENPAIKNNFCLITVQKLLRWENLKLNKMKH